MADNEVKDEHSGGFNVIKTLIAAFGFVLSIIFILSSMIVLVRFWIFSNLLYNIFTLSTFIIGVLFNIYSANLFLFEYDLDFNVSWPFVFLTPVTIFWTVFGMILPIIKRGYYKRFSYIPIFTYPQSFYDGDSYNEETATDHPFAKIYQYDSIFFNNQSTIMLTLFIGLAVQVIFWVIVFGTYRCTHCAIKNSIKVL